MLPIVQLSSSKKLAWSFCQSSGQAGGISIERSENFTKNILFHHFYFIQFVMEKCLHGHQNIVDIFVSTLHPHSPTHGRRALFVLKNCDNLELEQDDDTVQFQWSTIVQYKVRQALISPAVLLVLAGLTKETQPGRFLDFKRNKHFKLNVISSSPPPA